MFIQREVVFKRLLYIFILVFLFNTSGLSAFAEDLVEPVVETPNEESQEQNIVDKDPTEEASDEPEVDENEEGSEGGNGGTGDDPSFVVTGDVEGENLITNNVNSNQTEASCADCDTATGSPATTSDETWDTGSTTPVVTVENQNNASTTNEVSLDANTGDNLINASSSSSSDAVISTGDIKLINIIVNFINNNFFGKGQQFFIDIFNQMVGTIDLSGFGNSDNENDGSEQEGSTCATKDCELNVNNQSTSTLDNKIKIDADTGDNLIVDSDTGEIETGDINIINDIVNVANLNVTGEGWFFAVVNIFGALDGDVILPAFPDATESYSKEDNEGEEKDIEEEVSTSSPETSKEVYIANANMSDTLNDIAVNANTGNNNASSSGESQIETGDIDLEVNTFNFVNYNITGDYWKFAKINIFGDWKGFIEGLPEGFSYMEDEFGVTVYNDFLNNSVLNASYAKQTVLNYNQASTTNEIEIDANTGNNTVSGSGDSYIHTGDINITSSLVNFINGNFTGNNWEFSMINVFGEWEGNLAFGQGDLWITEAVSAEEVGSGEFIKYTFLYGNRGDNEATDVQVLDNFDEGLVDVVEASEGEVLDGGRVLWRLGTLQPNTQGSFSYVVKAKNNLSIGQYDIVNQVRVSSYENDRFYDDNIAEGLVLLDVNSSSRSSSLAEESAGGTNNVFPSLSVVKTNSKNGIAYPGDLVDYKIVVKNTGSADLDDVLVQDIMMESASSDIIKQALWDLGKLYKGEEVVIEYTVKIEDDAVSKSFINEVMAEGYDAYRSQFIHAVGSSKVKINEPVFSSALLERPDLKVALRTDNIFYNAGDIASVEIVVTNNGGKQAKEIDLITTLPEGLTFLEESDKVNSRWNIDWINPGGIETIKKLVKIGETIQADSYKIHTSFEANNFLRKEKVANINVRRLEVLAANYEAPDESVADNQNNNSEKDKVVLTLRDDKEASNDKNAPKEEEDALLTSFNNIKDSGAKEKISSVLGTNYTTVEKKAAPFDLLILLLFMIVSFILLLYLYYKLGNAYLSKY